MLCVRGSGCACGSSKAFSRPDAGSLLRGLGCNYQLFIAACDLRPDRRVFYPSAAAEGRRLASGGALAADAVLSKQTLPDGVLYTLSVQHAAPTDAGAYGCSVTEELSGESVLMLPPTSLMFPPSSSAPVLLPPVEELVVPLHSTFSLTCRGEARLAWSTPLAAREEAREDHGGLFVSTVVVDNATATHTGYYACSYGGNATEEVEESSLYVYVPGEGVCVCVCECVSVCVCVSVSVCVCVCVSV
ncbi:Platelet-derived growth factor receptor alpha [Liparis tanakae]|uniref:Platelet-derived growth factor receptor alpha n=1 Tax=Liparis tanakae TaxID=230148 RepID=A0A4Z2EAD0_9TELE|nr:Platelet-derived growth factor receptor alpha [Liparis tanakae]